MKQLKQFLIFRNIVNDAGKPQEFNFEKTDLIKKETNMDYRSSPIDGGAFSLESK